MRLLRFFLWLSAVFAILVALLYITDTDYLLKGIRATYLNGTKTASIDDAKYFDLNLVKATNPEAWSIAEDYNQIELSDKLMNSLEETGTVAFLVVKNDQILYEKYWSGYTDSSRSNIFSMAKSITTLLVQKAIQESYIDSWDDKVTKYLPELQGAYSKDLTLRDLSMMTAGLDWNEHYTNPFDITAQTYYGNDLQKTMFQKVHVVIEPGSEFEYQSGATQYLGFIISRATGMSVSDYASKTLWHELGAEHSATWHLDAEDGDELSYCCFNSNARDLSRFGKLILNHGRWNGEEVIDSSFLAKATVPGASDYYGWSFWILQDHLENVFYMRGHLGQYVIMIPSRDLVVVRLGKKSDEQTNHHHNEFRLIVKEVLSTF